MQKEKEMEEEERNVMDGREKVQGSTGPGSTSAPGAAATDPAQPNTEPKPKKQVGYGPRYRGPFMYLVYGVELLIGTRQRKPKTKK